jgi:capsular polysaccharide biosynthesis protein
MTSKLFDILPWRLQSRLGYRPYKMISLYDNPARFKIINGRREPEIEKIYPVSSPDTELLPFFDRINLELYQEHCSDFTCLEIKKIRIYNYDHQVAIISGNTVLKEPSPYMNKNLLTGEVIKHKHPVQSIFKLGKTIKRLKGKTLVLPIMGAHNNYFHFSLDLLPKIGNIIALGYSIDSFDQIVINENNAKYVSEWLDIVGIPTKKVITINPNEHWEIDFGVIPFHDKHCYNGFKYVKKKALSFASNSTITNKDFGKKIFVSRKPEEGRSFVHETEILESLLFPLGYVVVYPQDLSLQQQINLFQQADEVIMPHGAGMTNIIFCKPGTKIIEIHDKDVLFNSDYYPYVVFNNLKYGYYRAQSTTNFFKKGKLYNDLILDKQDLCVLLKKMGMS